MRRSNKIFTFKFVFKVANDETDETEFCAERVSEAVCLFNDWCVADEGMPEPATIIDIDIVYNASDADEYGELYGTPEDYDKRLRTLKKS